MKNILYAVFVIYAFCLTIACTENRDGYYDNIPRLYFPAETDSLNFSFGDKLPEYKRHIVYFPVRLLGMKTEREMRFKITVDRKRTTAKEGIHFTALKEEYSFPADSINAYIPIELIREHIPEEEVVYRIVIGISPNADFESGIKESLTGILTFNNYLEKPGWWDSIFSAYAPNYKPGMYQRIIAYYGHTLDEKYTFMHYLELMTVFKKQVYDYAQEHPELGWEFNDNLWWPFI